MTRQRKGPGRITAKGTRPAGTPAPPMTSHHYHSTSPVWVPVAIAVFLAAGVAVIFANYLGWLPGSASNWWLLAGLGSVLVGIVFATQYK